MLISHKHKFIIIDIPKTGSRSWREAFISLGAYDIIGQPPNRETGWEQQPFFQHTTIAKCTQGLKDLGFDANDYYKYARVRNPWSRIASFVNYTVQKAEQYEGLISNKIKISDCIVQSEDAMKESYRRWVDGHKRDYHSILKHVINRLPIQAGFVTIDGEPVMNQISRFEDLEDSFKLFCDAVGIEPVPDLPHSNKGVYTSPWKDMYTQELIDMVAEKEKWVIENFNYEY